MKNKIQSLPRDREFLQFNIESFRNTWSDVECVKWGTSPSRCLLPPPTPMQAIINSMADDDDDYAHPRRDSHYRQFQTGPLI